MKLYKIQQFFKYFLLLDSLCFGSCCFITGFCDSDLPLTYNQLERIIGGSDAIKGQYPWTAFMVDNDLNFCAASLINEQWLVTASHCCAIYELDSLYAYLGGYNLTSESGGETSVKVSQCIQVNRDAFQCWNEFTWKTNIWLLMFLFWCFQVLSLYCQEKCFVFELRSM